MEYSELRKKHAGLPTEKLLQEEFDFDKGDLKEALKQVYSKIEILKDSFSSCVEPDPNSYLGIYEHSCLDENERERIFELSKRLRYLMRSIDVAQLKTDEDRIETLIAVVKRWQDIKAESIKHLEMIRDSWLKEEDEQTKQDYLG